MLLTYETDEIGTYLRIPAGFTVGINGQDYVIVEQDATGFYVKTFELSDDGTEFIGREYPIHIDFEDIESLHIY